VPISLLSQIMQLRYLLERIMWQSATRPGSSKVYWPSVLIAVNVIYFGYWKPLWTFIATFSEGGSFLVITQDQSGCSRKTSLKCGHRSRKFGLYCKKYEYSDPWITCEGVKKKYYEFQSNHSPISVQSQSNWHTFIKYSPCWGFRPSVNIHLNVIFVLILNGFDGSAQY